MACASLHRDDLRLGRLQRGQHLLDVAVPARAEHEARAEVLTRDDQVVVH